jgi:hypothetical protein
MSETRPAVPGIAHGNVLGRVDDADGFAVSVGVYNGTVTVGDEFPYRFTQAQAEEFAQLFVRACWEAARQGGAS